MDVAEAQPRGPSRAVWPRRDALPQAKGKWGKAFRRKALVFLRFGFRFAQAKIIILQIIIFALSANKAAGLICATIIINYSAERNKILNIYLRNRRSRFRVLRLRNNNYYYFRASPGNKGRIRPYKARSATIIISKN